MPKILGGAADVQNGAAELRRSVVQIIHIKQKPKNNPMKHVLMKSLNCIDMLSKDWRQCSISITIEQVHSQDFVGGIPSSSLHNGFSPPSNKVSCWVVASSVYFLLLKGTFIYSTYVHSRFRREMEHFLQFAAVNTVSIFQGICPRYKTVTKERKRSKIYVQDKYKCIP